MLRISKTLLSLLLKMSMREIKFRGLAATGWEYGAAYYHEPPLQCFGGSTEPGEWFIMRTGFADWNMPRMAEARKIKQGTIGQYAGLKDVKGKDIFESDILKSKSGVLYEVCFEDGAFQIKRTTGTEVKQFTNQYYFEVIGNIHENPELSIS